MVARHLQRRAINKPIVLGQQLMMLAQLKQSVVLLSCVILKRRDRLSLPGPSIVKPIFRLKHIYLPRK